MHQTEGRLQGRSVCREGVWALDEEIMGVFYLGEEGGGVVKITGVGIVARGLCRTDIGYHAKYY